MNKQAETYTGKAIAKHQEEKQNKFVSKFHQHLLIKMFHFFV